MKKENKNFLLNVFYHIIIHFLPLITTVYISRVLGAENVGIYSYSYSIVYMFMLIAMLGVSNYGNRSIARVRHDKEERSTIFWSIYYLQIIITSIVCCFYFLFLFLCPIENRLIFLLQGIFLLSVFMDINWFYFGLEKFRVTISRNLIIKMISIILIFIFVRNENDLWIYILIMGSATFLSQLYLLIILRKYVFFKRISIKLAFSHLKHCLILFIPVLAYGIYRVMDKIMIGAMSSEIELGYYENAEKLINIPIMVITALGTVMLPHMANLFKDGDIGNVEYKAKIYDSMKLALIVATISACGLVLIGKDVVIVLFGVEFTRSGGVVCLLSLTIIASAWANVIRTQFLIPTNRDKIYVISTIIGAAINLFFNLIFIPFYGAYGACIGTIAAEFSVMIYQTVCVRKELEVNRYLKLLLINFCKALAIIAVSYLVGIFIKNIVLRLISKIIISVVLFGVLNYKYIVFEFCGREHKGGTKNEKGQSM